MENISEALKMAFGMLIAVLLIALMVFVFKSISGLENTKRDEELIKEATEFNKRFSAFDKSLMYGTDVISVIGLAISNNKIYNQEKYSNPLGNYDATSQYSIDIEFKIPTAIKKQAYIEKIEEKQLDTDFDGKVDKVEQVVIERKKLKEDDTMLYAETPYKLSNFNIETLYQDYKEYLEKQKSNSNAEPTGEYKKYKAIEDIALNGDKGVKIKERQSGIYLIRTTEDLTGYKDFKNVIFKCAEVKYNNVGRIYYMRFVPR